ncbi:MAG: large conductance mechanosensitive channel protein MscL [Candidatus Dormibacteria bacterium]
MRGFKNLLLRGNLVDLAIGFVIGAAFTALVQALVKGLITPLLAALAGQPNFSALYFTLNHSRFLYGTVVNALLSFVLVVAVLYFLVVLPFESLLARLRPAAVATTKSCPECLSAIPLQARRCAYCTSPQANPG